MRSSQPAAIAVTTAGPTVAMAYTAVPAELNYTFEDNKPFRDQPADPLFTSGAQVNLGPLIFREHQGWDTRIQVQNLSSVLNAKVKVYFLDEGGDVIHTLVDWICPRGSQSFTLAAISHLPGSWIGQVRVESQKWITPGSGAVPAPNISSTAQLVRWAGPAHTAPLAAVSYQLLTEEQVFSQEHPGLIGLPALSSEPTGSVALVSHIAIQNLIGS